MLKGLEEEREEGVEEAEAEKEEETKIGFRRCDFIFGEI
jgi:hypothetical protein